MKITTKTGDKGQTSLFGGKKVQKNHVLIELVGLLDELQAFVAFAKISVENEDMQRALEKVIDDLYRAMSIVGFGLKIPKNIEPIGEPDVAFLEQYMEIAQKNIGDLNKFIRPGTTEAAGRLNVARCVCRRVERAFVDSLGDEAVCTKSKLVLPLIKYLNRLSDLIFIFGYSLEDKKML